MRAIIMAGGKGTRIASVRSDVPKPMIEICGKPILQYQIENLRSCGITDITLGIGHLGDVIKNYFGDGAKFGVKINYFVEAKPLGTAGMLFKMLDAGELNEDFLLLSGDIIFDLDFNRFIKFHREKNAWASLMVHPNGHPYDSSLLVTEILPPKEAGGMPVETCRVTKWLAKDDEVRTRNPDFYYKNCVNAGVQIISPELIKATKEMLKQVQHDKNQENCHPELENCHPELENCHPELVSGSLPEKIDLDRDVLKTNIASGKIFAYCTPEYIKDMGTPDRYYETENDIKSGKVGARNLSRKQKAIFLDRDGTINKENGFVTTPQMLQLADSAAEAIKKINKSGYLAIVVTNQPVIARGECTFEQLQEIHNKMETLLGKEGAFVDAIYFCPHHPDKGFEGERVEYKCVCDCRKPKPGMLLQAAADFNIDLSQSFMIGDREKDVKTGERAGCKKSILLEGDTTLLQAVENILGEE